MDRCITMVEAICRAIDKARGKLRTSPNGLVMTKEGYEKLLLELYSSGYYRRGRLDVHGKATNFYGLPISIVDEGPDFQIAFPVLH